MHVKNGVISWPLTSSKILVLVAQPISTDGGPPAWAVDKRAELGRPSSREKGGPPSVKWPTFMEIDSILAIAMPDQDMFVLKNPQFSYRRT